jgi:hypothetical protein
MDTASDVSSPVQPRLTGSYPALLTGLCCLYLSCVQLDAAGLDGDLKHTLMSALVLAFGVQVMLQYCCRKNVCVSFPMVAC